MNTTIKQFGKQELAVLRTDIQSAFDNIKSKYGLAELTLGTIRFSTSSFTATISGKAENAEGNVFEKNEADFFAIRHGLPQNLIGCEFLLDGGVFTISRIETRKPKYPIIAQCKEDGRTFKFTVPRIKELLEKHRVISI